jgi:putative membrane protein
MLEAYAYLIHMLAGLLLMSVFFVVYTKITPFDEIALIRKGDVAAALSLAGGMIGFCLTLVSSILHNDTLLTFVIWGSAAMAIQALSYLCIARILPQMNESIENNNIAMGVLMGTISLVVGMINAACLS